MFDGRWRAAVDRSTGPVGQSLQRRGVTADILTASGLVFSALTALAVASGHLLVAVPLLAVTGCHDLLDGPVAKAAGTASARGAFFDSVADRVSDAVILGGVAWYLAGRHEGHLAVLPLAVLGMTALISYERAKAEVLGISARGGLMERAERMILLGVGLLASWLLVPVLWIMLALISVTAVTRFAKVWRLAEGPVRPARPVRRWREGRVESRWRARREGVATRPAARRSAATLGRWRARRLEAPGSRTGRARKARRTRQTLHGTSASGSRRSGRSPGASRG